MRPVTSLAQLTGGVAGSLAAAWLLGGRLSHPAVNYVATAPGDGGDRIAFAAEAVISFGMMTTVLECPRGRAPARFTGLAAGGWSRCSSPSRRRSRA